MLSFSDHSTWTDTDMWRRPLTKVRKLFVGSELLLLNCGAPFQTPEHNNAWSKNSLHKKKLKLGDSKSPMLVLYEKSKAKTGQKGREPEKRGSQETSGDIVFSPPRWNEPHSFCAQQLSSLFFLPFLLSLLSFPKLLILSRIPNCSYSLYVVATQRLKRRKYEIKCQNSISFLFSSFFNVNDPKIN